MKKGPLKIVFMGTPDFAVHSLQALVESEHEVVAVVTQPDKQKGRGKKLAATPVKQLAEHNGIKVHQPSKIKTQEFLDTLKAYQADIFVVVAYGRILPEQILNLPPLGCINVHGSLLPKHRGAAPIQWAVLSGDKEAGVTIMQMDVGMDTGDILLQQSYTMDKDETSGSLFDTLAELGATTLINALELIGQNKLQPVAQQHDQATMAPPLKKEQGRLDWSQTAEQLHRQIRGFSPWPSAYTFLNGKRFRLFAPKVVHKSTDLAAGTIYLANREGLLIATGKGSLLIRELQPEGKKRLSVEAFLCGHRLETPCTFQNS